ncbi:MAG: hypothetical protein JWL63_2391 [Rhodocyclales bacterium]|nr:hypothetical protein [Rhodocyclales bacterium]
MTEDRADCERIIPESDKLEKPYSMLLENLSFAHLYANNI